MTALAVAAALGALGGGCRTRSEAAVDCAARPLEPGVARACTVPGWPGRDVIVRLPTRGDGPLPLVLALHGGGGRKESMDEVTCADGDPAHATCLSRAADARGVVVAYPDGTAAGRGRFWNDGPAAGEWRAPPASALRSDDVAYLRAVADHVAALAQVDRGRVYATGLSNGAGMSHRLACDASETFAAIAAVGGGNRAALTGGCAPVRGVAVLQIHGDADPVWPFAGGESEVRFIEGRYPAIPWAVVGGGGGGAADEGWVKRLGCRQALEGSPLPDRSADGMASSESRWERCRDGAEVRFVVVRGGGHTWPGGDAYLGERIIGRVTRDFSASEMALDFLLRFSRDGASR